MRVLVERGRRRIGLPPAGTTAAGQRAAARRPGHGRRARWRRRRSSRLSHPAVRGAIADSARQGQQLFDRRSGGHAVSAGRGGASRTASSTPAATARALSEIARGVDRGPARVDVADLDARPRRRRRPPASPRSEPGDGGDDRLARPRPRPRRRGHDHRRRCARRRGTRPRAARAARASRVMPEHRRRHARCRPPPRRASSTRPRSGPRCVSTTACTSTPAAKPGPEADHERRVAGVACPGSRLAMRASTTHLGPQRGEAASRRGRPRRARTRRASARRAASGVDAAGPRTPSTLRSRRRRRPRANATSRRTASGCSRSSTTTRKPARKSRRAAAEASSPAAADTTERGARRQRRALPSGLEAAGQLHLHGADRRRGRRRAAPRSSRPAR